MINEEASNCYYFVVKSLSELYLSGWLKSKKKTTIINGDNDFQNALDEALNYQNIEKNPQRISKLKPSINTYNWKGIDFPAGPKDWKKFERINKKVALNILFIPRNTEWHYLAVTNLSALLQGKLSNHDRDFYCLDCFYSYTTKNKHE